MTALRDTRYVVTAEQLQRRRGQLLASRIRCGRTHHIRLPLDVVAALLVDPGAVLTLLDYLGRQVTETVLSSVAHAGDREYHRLVSVGVNHTTAAVLAAYHREAG